MSLDKIVHVRYFLGQHCAYWLCPWIRLCIWAISLEKIAHVSYFLEYDSACALCPWIS